jgi:hypothetical protein
MGETANLRLPLLAPSQAQKHVTVNEALVRLDALAKGVLASRRVPTPPAQAGSGEVWAVPAGATDEWAGREGELAIATGGGWSFVSPREGWRAYALDEGAPLRHDGADWAPEGATATALSGAATTVEVVELEHAVAVGPFSVTAPVIPRNALVLGVTARVVDEITGAATAWKLGHPTAGTRDRFGRDLGTAAGSYAEGLLGTPTAYYTPTALQMTTQDGDFAGGRVRFAVHLIRLTPPAAA